MVRNHKSFAKQQSTDNLVLQIKFIGSNNDNDNNPNYKFYTKWQLKTLLHLTQDKDGESIRGGHQKFSKRERNNCPPGILDVS